MKQRKRAIKFWLLRYVALPIGIVLAKIMARTWRFEKAERERFQEVLGDGRGIALALVHGHILMAVGLLQMSSIPRDQVVGLTSPSRDGLLMDKVLASLGLRGIKGSSSKHAALAIRGLAREIKHGSAGFLTVDGPRGPRLVPKQGIIAMADLADARLLHVFFVPRRSITLRSWDRFEIPLPFTRIHMETLTFDPSEWPGDSRQRRQQFETLIREAHQRAGSAQARED